MRWAEKTFPAAVRAAQIEDARVHDTRHTFASRLAMAGADVLTIKELGGWRTLSMVARYAHLSPGHQRAAVERLSQRSAMAFRRRQSHRESHLAIPWKYARPGSGGKDWSRGRELNPRPTDYESVALPLSYPGVPQ